MSTQASTHGKVFTLKEILELALLKAKWKILSILINVEKYCTEHVAHVD